MTKFTFLGAKISSLLMLKRTSAKAGTHTDLLVVDVDKNVQVSPFSEAPTNVIVLGHVASNEKKCPIFFDADKQLVDATLNWRCPT